MKCSTFSKSLKDYITEELSEEATELMTKHMSKCNSCKALYNKELKTFDFLQSMSSANNSSFISSRGDIMKNIDKARYSKTFTNKLRFFMKKNSFRYGLGSVAVASLIFIMLFSANHFNLANILPKKPHSETVSPTSNNNNVPNAQDEIYKNDALGFSFTIPSSWKGKYIIKETADGIYVYFKPKTTAPESTGLLFGIIKSTSIDADHFDTVGEPRTFEAKKIKYIVGGPTDIGFPDDHKEFNDYKKLSSEVKDVVKTIKVMDNKLNQQNNTKDNKNTVEKYENAKLGFSFTIPSSWKGKYTLKETADGIYVYFKPVNPTPETEGYGLLFRIVKESSADAGTLDTVPKPRTFEANGIKYIVAFPTDINFPENHPEFQDLMNLKTQVDDVVKTIKVINN